MVGKGGWRETHIIVQSSDLADFNVASLGAKALCAPGRISAPPSVRTQVGVGSHFLPWLRATCFHWKSVGTSADR